MNGLVPIIETSGRAGRVGLADGGTVVAEVPLEQARRHARDLVAAVRSVFAERGRKPRDATGVVVSIGPGSFTGLRVGLMTAKTFAYAVGCPLFGVGTFDAAARQVGPGRVEVIDDALQGKLFRRSYCDRRPAGPLQIVSADEWIATLTDEIVTGPGVPLVAARLPAKVRVAPEDARAPRIASLLAVALADPAGTHADPITLVPLYLRGSSAEEKLRAAAT